MAERQNRVTLGRPGEELRKVDANWHVTVAATIDGNGDRIEGEFTIKTTDQNVRQWISSAYMEQVSLNIVLYGLVTHEGTCIIVEPQVTDEEVKFGILGRTKVEQQQQPLAA